jgi:putative transposase
MSSVLLLLCHVMQCAYMLLTLLGDAARFVRLSLRSPGALAAENLFLRKQLALCQERHVKPRRATDAVRLALVWLARWFDWREALAVVQPATFIRWHRQGFRLFWRWKSQPGPSAHPGGPASSYPSFGVGESDLGSGTHCQ